MREVELLGVEFKNQIRATVEYKGLGLDFELRLDALVEEILCVEIKTQEDLLPILDAVFLSYLQML